MVSDCPLCWDGSVTVIPALGLANKSRGRSLPVGLSSPPTSIKQFFPVEPSLTWNLRSLFHNDFHPAACHHHHSYPSSEAPTLSFCETSPSKSLRVSCPLILLLPFPHPLGTQGPTTEFLCLELLPGLWRTPIWFV